MDRRKFSFSMVGTAVAGLVGCGGGGSDTSTSTPIATAPPSPEVIPPAPVSAPPPTAAPEPDGPVGPELATATALPASTVFLQTLEATDGDGSPAPGQANYWDLGGDFSIGDGSNDQFDGALAIQIDVGGLVESFPYDQSYAELTALGPEMDAADGLKLVSFTSDPHFVLSGATSAVLHPVPNARLRQVLDLGAALGHGVQLSWIGQQNGWSSDVGNEPFFIQVVVRDMSGALLSTLYREDNDGVTGTWGAASMTAFAGQVVVLSFEQRAAYAGTQLDNVSVTDTTTHAEFVVNGDFEAGSLGWSVPVIKVSQNILSGVRAVNGLQVRRAFYTQPNRLWARITDSYFNPSGASITAAVSYLTNLGSDNFGIVYPTPGAPTKAISTWDSQHQDRDIGMVFGAADSVAYTSLAAGGGTGSDDVTVTFNISVPAGGMVTLMNFMVLTGTDTGLTAVDANTRATQVDTAAAAIANDFRTDFAYQRGLTQVQLDTLQNF